MEIFRFDTRLFMIMETDDNFSFDKKTQIDAGNQKVQEWEALMWNYQQPLKNSLKGEKWVLMNKIFEFEKIACRHKNKPIYESTRTTTC